jgi:hypothetical protein
MANGTWKKKVDALVLEAGSEIKSKELTGLSDATRHQSILRKKLLLSLQGTSEKSILAGCSAHAEMSNAIEDVVEALVVSSQKDGFDLDGELIDLLTDISAKLFAVEQTWSSIHGLLKTN